MGTSRRVLVASPVHQQPEILQAFLDGILQLEHGDLEVAHAFVDDNDDERSSRLLGDFAAAVPGTLVVPIEVRGERYVRDETTHHWSEQLVWRVAQFKDALIEHALEQGYDRLFLVDSDLVLHPGTLPHLDSRDVDVVSEVFWTRWKPGNPELPQVWASDVYELVPMARGERLSGEERARRLRLVLSQLRTPGMYEVGGLGACTMISRAALEAGARFREIPNLSFWGEDRHFCIRAAALGLRLHADTVLPPLHLYRAEDLDRVPAFADSVGLTMGALAQRTAALV